jgi:hypothetical protein
MPPQILAFVAKMDYAVYSHMEAAGPIPHERGIAWNRYPELRS